MAESMQSQIKRLEKKLKEYAEKDIPKASASALTRITGKVKSHLTRTVAHEVKIPAKFIRSRVFATRATSSTLRAYVKSYLKPILAARLLSASTLQKHKGTGTNRRGVKVAGTQIDGAFINVGTRDGKYHVLLRRGMKRYPIFKQSVRIDLSLSAHQMPIATKFSRDDFQKELIRQLEYRLSKYVR